MITTNNPVFNALMDQLLSPQDRKLGIVSPKSIPGDTYKPSAVGVIVKLSPDLRKAYENSKDRLKAQIEALEVLTLLCDLAKNLDVSFQEIP